MKYQLIIFDMDGTLVQSEDCGSQALIDVVPALPDTAAQITEQYRGVRLADIINDIERRFPGAVPENCAALYREREKELSSLMVTPSDGVDQMLAALTVKKCIASNAPIEKTNRSLDICGIAHYFNDAVFSAYQVEAWKPDPTLFERVAAFYGVVPENCLVVEDSDVGIRAAQAAGMTPVFYDPFEMSAPYDGVARITALSELVEIANE